MLSNERIATDSARVAFVGGGNMAQAILSGWLAAHSGPAALWDASTFQVANPGQEKRELIQQKWGVSCVKQARELDQADLVVLAVKPQKMAEVLAGMADLPWLAHALVVSIAAGLDTQGLERQLPVSTAVVRTMPNTPLQVGQGATTLCAGTHATTDDLELVRSLFASIGSAYVVSEDLIDATSAISGSGPAYLASMIEALAAAGAQAGLDIALAEQLALDTFAGTGAMMKATGTSAARTRQAVSSPGGSTLAALAAMEQAGFSESLHRGVEAAIQRSKELGSA